MKKLLVVLLLWSSCLYAQTRPEDVKSFTLSNGMKVFVLEDHSIPNANMYLFWKVGSRNEYPGITGLSHFFEHMMFNGAEKYGPKQFDQVMEKWGGRNNAYTTENVTVYTNWFPSTSLETIFDLEADRISKLNLDDKMIESERGVVLSERSTGLENSNYRFLSDYVKSSAFMQHPYRWSVIGYESDIKNWNKEDLQRYYTTYYAPNNCVLVISGSVKAKEVEALAKKYFEPIPAQKPPRPVHTDEPEQKGERRVMVQKQTSTPNLMIAYHVPETQSEDYYALDLLSSVLTSGKSSRMYSSLIDKQELATSIFTNYPMSFDPNLFYIYAIANRDVSTDALEKGIYAEIDRIATEGVSANELQKVKNQKVMSFYKSIETIDGRSNNIGTYELFFGDYRKLYDAPKAYEKITSDDLKRVAAKYFKASNRTVGIMQTSVEPTP
jgi:zinc protease